MVRSIEGIGLTPPVRNPHPTPVLSIERVLFSERPSTGKEVPTCNSTSHTTDARAAALPFKQQGGHQDDVTASESNPWGATFLDAPVHVVLVADSSLSTKNIVSGRLSLPIWAARKEQGVAATCRIVRLEEVVSDYRFRAEREIAEILEAISDREVTPAEAARIMEVLQSWTKFADRLSTELSLVADGAEMVRSLASTFAVTPKIERKFREKGADYLRLVVKNDLFDPLEAA